MYDLVDSLFSLKKYEEILVYSKRMDELYESGTIESRDYMIIQKLIVLFGKTILEKEKNKSNREFVKYVENRMYEWFLKNVYNNYSRHFNNIYDLPLNINLIEANLLTHEIKVYLQRPGLLIGKGGSTIEALEKHFDTILELENNKCKILIVETKGRTKIVDYL